MKPTAYPFQPLAALALGAALVGPTTLARQVLVIDGGAPMPVVVAGGGAFPAGPAAASPVPVTADQLQGYLDLLKTDDAQRELAQQLYTAYVGDLTALTEAHRQAMAKLHAELQESGDHAALFEKMPPLMQDLATRREALTTALFDDVRLLLSADQEARWSTLERARRRDTLLPLGSLSGEQVDLARLVQDLDLAAPPETLAYTLESYEQELDKALVEREASAGMSQAFHPGEIDVEKMMERADKRRDLSMKVRGVNQKFYERILAELPPADAERLADAFQKASFPQIYQRSFVDRTLDMALAFTDLTDDQQAAVAQVRADRERELAAANAEWARELRQAEDEGSGDVQMAFGGGAVSFGVAADGAEPSDLDEARKARRDLDDRTLERIRALLGEDQLARLPERRSFRTLPNGMEIMSAPGERALIISEMVGEDGSVRRTQVEIHAGDGEQGGATVEEEVDVIVVPDAEKEEGDGSDA